MILLVGAVLLTVSFIVLFISLRVVASQGTSFKKSISRMTKLLNEKDNHIDLLVVEIALYKDFLDAIRKHVEFTNLVLEESSKN